MKIYRNDFFQYYSYFENEKNEQGWKIHIYSDLIKSEQILEICKEISFQNKINFKHLHNFNELKHFKCKETDYKFAGKFITFYIGQDDLYFKKIISLLYEKLKYFGSYKIIGDRNYKNSIINYRYGNYNPERDYIVSKDFKKIKDSRNSYIPKGSGIKDPLIGEIKSENEIILNKKYKILSVLLFSNVGGIFLAENILDKQKYVLKEDRFYKINNESTRINEIAFSFNKPLFIEKFLINNSLFLVFEYIQGINLANIQPKDLKNQKFLLNIVKNLYKTMKEFHKRNIIMNDVKIDNFILGENDKIFFIDREHCYYKNSKKIKTENIFIENWKNMFEISPEHEDKLKIAEITIQLLNLRKEPFFISKNPNNFLEYLKYCFISEKISADIYNFIKSMFDDKIYKFSNTELTFFSKKDKRNITNLINNFYEKNKILFSNIKPSFSTELNKNSLYGFIFEKIINNNIDITILQKWKNEKLDYENFEDNMKMILILKYNSKNEIKNDFIQEKIIKIIKKFVTENDKQFFITTEKYFVPYIEKGLGLLAIILVEVLEKWKFQNKIIFQYLVKFYRSLLKFPLYSTKTSFLFGSSGISFLILYIGSFLKRKNSQYKAKNKLFNLVFMQDNLKWQSQENKTLDNSFFNGNEGIKWAINFVFERGKK